MPTQGGYVRQPERRRAPRFPFDAALEIEWGSAVLRGRVRDISEAGMAVSIQDPLWIGANFSARLNLEEPLQVDCVVRRVEPAQGMGLSFVVQDVQDRARIAALLEVLAGK